MRNISAGIIIFVIVISLGFIIFFGFFKHPQKQELIFEYNENSSKDFVLSSDSEIEYFEGSLEKKGAQDLGWVLASERELIQGDTEFRTKKDSRALILFKNGAVLRISENTELSVNFDGAKMKLVLIEGEIHSRMIGFEKNQYEISVGNHKIISENGSLFVKRNKEREVNLVVVEGEGKFENGINGTIENVSFQNVLEVSNDVASVRELKKEDVEKDFVSWSIGKGKQEEIFSQLDGISESDLDEEENEQDGLIE